MFHYIDTAAAARDTATVLDTKTKRSSAWQRWNTFLHTIGITSVYLDGISRFQQNIIISGLAQAVRSGTFSKGDHKNLVEGTVSTTLAHVAQTFRANNRHDPRLDHDGKTSYILQEQYRGYSNQDRAQKNQKALPIAVLRKMMELVFTDKEKALGHLCIGAIFFAMRSCEYLQSNHKEDSKPTRILRLRNIIFKRDGNTVNHDSPWINYSELVIITFEFQKNTKRNKTVHMFKTNDVLLCPVKAWATTVNRIWNTVPGADGDTRVCAYNDHGQASFIDSSYARAKLRGTVELIGEEALGFTKEDVGLHSIRSGGAMAMFLSGVPTIIIQRVGRWESDAFMEYIREQVESFTAGVSSKMIKNETFYHLNKTSYTGEYDTNGNIITHSKWMEEPTVIPGEVFLSGQTLEFTNS